jgi:hypothetical protein
VSDRIGPPPAIHRVIPPATPPSRSPDKALVTYESLIDKPESFEEVGIEKTGDRRIEGRLWLHKAKEEPLLVERDEVDPDKLPLIGIRRHGQTFGYVGLDENDHITIFTKDHPEDDDDTNITAVASFDKDLPERLNRNTTADILPMLALLRNGSPLAHIGLNADDNFAIISADGSTVLASLDDTGFLKVLLKIRTMKYFDQNDKQLLTDQQPAIADAAAAGVTAGFSLTDPVSKADFDAVASAFNVLAGAFDDLVTKFNTLLAEARTHGFIDT